MLPLYIVQFDPCGAESHPAFSGAILMPNGRYQIEYPVKLKHMPKGASAQHAWADDKARHLRSWVKSNPLVIKV